MKTKLIWLTGLMFLGLMIGCSGLFKDDLNNDTEKNGTVMIKITDAPFPSDIVAEANITIDWIKLLKSTSSENMESEDENAEEGTETEDDDSSSVFIELDEPLTFNLMELSNGQTGLLVQADLPAGVYREIRLHITDAGIVLTDDSEFDLKVPGGNASGLKIKVVPSLEIEGGLVSELLLDFDVSRSFVLRGNMNNGNGKVVGFIFKPVVRAVAEVATGEIYGIVKDTSDALIENALLTLLSGDDTVTTASSSAEGTYRMIGIPTGEFSLECVKEGYKDQIENVSVQVNEETEQNFDLVKTE